jgi:trans-2,3-dihydro-3-hydroxyanthranilate isomerase
VPITVPFYLVDVFAEQPLTGNPLALVMEAERLDEALLKPIAREFNQSETTYLLPATEPAATWRLRSFTPSGAEVFGAGHNALGAWWWLASAGELELLDGAGHFTQQLGRNVLPVEVLPGADGRPAAISMDQAPASFGAVVDRLPALVTALGLALGDLRTDIRAQVVSTGAAHLLVPAIDRTAVDRARPRPAALLTELQHLAAQGCYLYSLDPVDKSATAYARFFNPTVGIWEDPATGSAAGPLASHLVTQGIAPGNDRLLIEQGHALGRPSLLQVDIEDGQVRLVGAGVVVAEGTLHV